MPSLHEDLAYMQAAAQDAITAIGGYDLRQFQQNREKQAALCYLLVIVGRQPPESGIVMSMKCIRKYRGTDLLECATG